MAVNPGQRVSASVTNNAFMSRLVDTDTVGKVALQKPSGSGALINDVQQALNNIFSVAGMADETISSPTYSSTSVVTQNTSHTVAIGALDLSLGTSNTSLASLSTQVSNIINGVIALSSINTGAETNAVATGAGAEVTTPTNSILYLTNASLTSIAGITATPFNRWLILCNKTGAQISIENLGTVSTSKQIETGTGADLDLADNANLLLFYDTTDLLWRVVGGTGGGGGAVSYQETPTGTVDGVNAVFGPLTYMPTDNNSVLVMVDGVVRVLGTAFTVSSGTITFQSGYEPALGQDVYAFYSTEGTPVAPVLSGTYRVENRVLTSGEASAEQLTLAFTPGTPSYVAVDPEGGPTQFFGLDFTVSGNILSWSGLGLSGLLSTGDRLRIIYTE